MPVSPLKNSNDIFPPREKKTDSERGPPITNTGRGEKKLVRKQDFNKRFDQIFEEQAKKYLDEISSKKKQ